MECVTGLENCNFLELIGINGDDNPDDFDIYDPSIFNITAGVYAAGVSSGYLDEDAGYPFNGGSVIYTAAVDRPHTKLWKELNANPWNNNRYVNWNKRPQVVRERLEQIEDYIKKHRLGTVHAVPDVINPNHGTKIKTRVWHMNLKGFQAWKKTKDYKTVHDNVKKREEGWRY